MIYSVLYSACCKNSCIEKQKLPLTGLLFCRICTYCAIDNKHQWVTSAAIVITAVVVVVVIVVTPVVIVIVARQAIDKKWCLTARKFV